MRDLSLIALDIAYNSVKASASRIKIELKIFSRRDLIYIKVCDNGEGMTKERLDGLFTSDVVKNKCGMGLRLLKAQCEMCDGEFVITSESHRGTEVYASFRVSAPDTPPIGDFAATMSALLALSSNTKFTLDLGADGKGICYDMGGEDLSYRGKKIIEVIKQYIENINGGKLYEKCSGIGSDSREAQDRKRLQRCSQ